MKKVRNNNDFYLFANTFSKMNYVSSIVFFKLFTKTTCENRLYYAVFGSSRLQKRLEYGGNVKNKLFVVIFKSEKTKDFVRTIDKVFPNLLTTLRSINLGAQRLNILLSLLLIVKTLLAFFQNRGF